MQSPGLFPRRQRRIVNCSYRGSRLYFLTILTKGRKRFFEDVEVTQVCLTQFHRAAERASFSIRAGTVMPDHVHLFVEGRTADADLISFVKLAKQLSGYHIKRITGRQLWSRGYYDRIVRHAEDPRRFVEYILRNPVKAGLADSIGVHPYTWADEISPTSLT